VRLIEVFLFEAKCPLCGDTNAYEGFRDVECTTKGCKNFSQKQYDEINKSSGSNTYKFTVEQVDLIISDSNYYRSIQSSSADNNNNKKHHDSFIQKTNANKEYAEANINELEKVVKFNFTKDEIKFIKDAITYCHGKDPVKGGYGNAAREKILLDINKQESTK
jgi:hypothetical protein